VRTAGPAPQRQPLPAGTASRAAAQPPGARPGPPPRRQPPAQKPATEDTGTPLLDKLLADDSTRTATPRTIGDTGSITRASIRRMWEQQEEGR
jgi:hypothetical protein